MSELVISVEHITKRYELGVINTGTLSRDLNKWFARLQGKPDPYTRIDHHGGIVTNQYASIGKNCNLSHGVTIGVTRRGESAGVPQIGDNVYIGPGAKIIGNVKVGNNAAVGANCVVTKDLPDYGVVVGIPGKVISMEGSTG